MRHRNAHMPTLQLHAAQKTAQNVQLYCITAVPVAWRPGYCMGDGTMFLPSTFNTLQSKHSGSLFARYTKPCRCLDHSLSRVPC